MCFPVWPRLGASIPPKFPKDFLALPVLRFQNLVCIGSVNIFQVLPAQFLRVFPLPQRAFCLGRNVDFCPVCHSLPAVFQQEDRDTFGTLSGQSHVGNDCRPGASKAVQIVYRFPVVAGDILIDRFPGIYRTALESTDKKSADILENVLVKHA